MTGDDKESNRGPELCQEKKKEEDARTNIICCCSTMCLGSGLTPQGALGVAEASSKTHGSGPSSIPDL